MANPIDQLEGLGVLPVSTVDDVDTAMRVADALVEGGLPAIEITFRTDVAAEAITALARQRSEVLIAAGTIRTAHQARQAMDAGARLVVSPGTHRQVITCCQRRGCPVVPGACTPTEVGMALELGIEVVKFFPAESYGGLATIHALAAAYAGIRFVPTGGIHAANLAHYLEVPAVLACGGSWITHPSLVATGRFDRILQLAREAVATVQGIRK